MDFLFLSACEAPEGPQGPLLLGTPALACSDLSNIHCIHMYISTSAAPPGSNRTWLHADER